MNGQWSRFAVAGAIAVCLFASPLWGQQMSALWGERGEKYNPAGLLPDFSFAGYERGEKPIPERVAEVSVKQFGARGDGRTDDTAAFRRALKEGVGKVIGIPEGTYVLSDALEITDCGTVLKGAGQDKTTLLFTKPLRVLQPQKDPSYAGGLVFFKGSFERVKPLANIGEPGAKRGQFGLPVTDTKGLSVGQEVTISAKDPKDGSLVYHLYRDKVEDAKDLFGWSYLFYVARIREIKDKEIVMDRPLRFDVRPDWMGKLFPHKMTLHHSGIEDLAIVFPKSPWVHWKEPGWNAVYFFPVCKLLGAPVEDSQCRQRYSDDGDHLLYGF